MEPSQKAYDLIKHWEGVRLQSYQDEKGVWTIGYGCTGYNIVRGLTWTQSQADYALKDRVEAIGRILNGCIMSAITQNQFDSLLSLAYNIGQGAFRGSTILRLVNKRQFEEAAKEFPKWCHIGGKTSTGLLNRRLSEQALFCA